MRYTLTSGEVFDDDDDVVVPRKQSLGRHKGIDLWPV